MNISRRGGALAPSIDPPPLNYSTSFFNHIITIHSIDVPHQSKSVMIYSYCSVGATAPIYNEMAMISDALTAGNDLRKIISYSVWNAQSFFIDSRVNWSTIVLKYVIHLL